MHKKVLMVVLLFPFILCGNFLDYALSALGVPGAIFVLCSEVVLIGAFIILAFIDDRENFEQNRMLRLVNLVVGPVALLAYFVLQGWTVVDYINRFGSMN